MKKVSATALMGVLVLCGCAASKPIQFELPPTYTEIENRFSPEDWVEISTKESLYELQIREISESAVIGMGGREVPLAEIREISTIPGPFEKAVVDSAKVTLGASLAGIFLGLIVIGITGL